MADRSLTLIADEELKVLLPRKYRGCRSIHYPLTRRASIKDIIESLHIPHTEVSSIVCNGREISFEHIPQSGQSCSLYSFPQGTDLSRPTLLRPVPLPKPVFVVDINVGKLAGLLRMAGFDSLYDPQWQEDDLADLLAEEKRILLSRNRALLQRKCVQWGRLIRAQQAEDQLAEVLTLYGLTGRLKPFSRCMRCNTLLQPVDKGEIIHRLEPLTRKYYRDFSSCPGCDHIYWRGSHHKRMEELIGSIGRAG